MQIIPWTISGIAGLFQQIPEQLPPVDLKKRRFARFFRELMQNQVSILLIVPAGVLLLNGQQDYGLIPSMACYWYPVAFMAGVLLLGVGMGTSTLTTRLMQRYIPGQLEHDYRQYVFNMQEISAKNTMQSILLGLCNGFSEEMIMRVFLMGFLINYLHVSPIWAFILSVSLNGLHHTHQGRIMGVVSVIVIQSLYAGAYLIWNDFLFIGIMHVGTDISGLILAKILQQRQAESTEE